MNWSQNNSKGKPLTAIYDWPYDVALLQDAARRLRGPGGVGPGNQATVAPFELTEGDILAFARDKLGFIAEEAQLQFLISDAKRGIVNCCRQFGKSTIMAIKALFRALTVAGALVLVASPTKRQSGLFIAKVRGLARRLGMGQLKGDGYNELSLLFPNGSTIVGLPGTADNVRGFSAVSMLIIDEASRVKDELYEALRPTLAVGNGDLWLLSTPNGKQGFYYDAWALGGDRWTRVEATALECAGRITADFLDDELAAMGSAWVRQEFFGEFVDTGGEMFNRVVVDEALDDVEPLVF